MGSNTHYLLVDSRVLPAVFPKVLEAKQMLESGRARSVNEAVRMTGISRSAFYKYRSCIHEFDAHAGRIVTLQAMLRDEAGVLSKLTGTLYQSGANILTINQNIPINGVAPVLVTARITGLTVKLEELLDGMRSIDGVMQISVVSGG